MKLEHVLSLLFSFKMFFHSFNPLTPGSQTLQILLVNWGCSGVAEE